MSHSSNALTTSYIYIPGIECSSPNWPASVANVFCIVGEKKGGIAFWNLHNAPHISCKESGIASLTMLYYFGAFFLIFGPKLKVAADSSCQLRYWLSYLPTSLLSKPSPYSTAHLSTLSPPPYLAAHLSTMSPNSILSFPYLYFVTVPLTFLALLNLLKGKSRP